MATMGFMLLAMFLRTTVDVESECAGPLVISRNTLNMIVHMTQRVSRFCNDSHGSCFVGHLIHCSNAVITVIGKMSRLAKYLRAQGRTLMVRNTILCSQLALSGSAPLGGARPPRRCRRGLLWLATELKALDHGGRRALRFAQVQRLRDGPAWQTADEVRKVLLQFHRANQQDWGKGFKTRTTLTSLLSTAPPISSRSTGHILHRPPLCSTDADLDEGPRRLYSAWQHSSV